MEDKNRQTVNRNSAGNREDARRDGSACGERGTSISLKGADLKKMVIFSELMTPKFDG